MLENKKHPVLFYSISLEHIFGESNMEAYALSKEALVAEVAFLFWEEFVQNSLEHSGSINYFVG